MTGKRADPESIRNIFLKNLFMPFILSLLLISQGYAENTANSEQDIIQKIIDAYGGKAMLSKVISISAEGNIMKIIPEDDGTYYRYMKRDRKLFVDIKYTRSEEVRIMNGKKGYRGNRELVEEVKGPSYDAMVYQYNQLDIPFGFVDGTLKAADIRKDSVNGTEMTILKLKDQHGYEIEVYISTEDSLILKAIGYFQFGTSKRSLRTEFSEFRMVEGILLPFRIVNYANDIKLSETEITKYLINPKIDDSIFKP
ncbi:MAG: outer membrane lipoprotein-sorting protein [Nitrospira sp.]|nr:outer membrane lipoprotein-sorting protein [Nitrospira sp.]